MRLWLKDSERRPDPMPVRTDDQLAIYTGLALWLLGLLALLIVPAMLDLEYASWRIATCVIGLVLGVLGLIYTRFRKL
jgi:hypothetical protein